MPYAWQPTEQSVRHVSSTLGNRRLMTRRALLMGALAVPLLVACARAGGATDAPGIPWSFEDDRGVTATAPSRPQRIVAHVGSAAVLWDHGIRVVGTFGPRGRPDGSRNPL